MIVVNLLVVGLHMIQLTFQLHPSASPSAAQITNQLPQQLRVAIYYSMASIPSERIAVGGGNDDKQERLLPFLLFIFIYFYSLLTPYPPPSLLLSTPTTGRLMIASRRRFLIEGVEVEVEAEEVAEYVGVGKNN